VPTEMALFWIEAEAGFAKSAENFGQMLNRVATSLENLENLEKSGNFEIIRENLEKAGKNIKESGILDFAQFP